MDDKAAASKVNKFPSKGATVTAWICLGVWQCWDAKLALLQAGEICMGLGDLVHLCGIRDSHPSPRDLGITSIPQDWGTSSIPWGWRVPSTLWIGGIPSIPLGVGISSILPGLGGLIHPPGIGGSHPSPKIGGVIHPWD